MQLNYVTFDGKASDGEISDFTASPRAMDSLAGPLLAADSPRPALQSKWRIMAAVALLLPALSIAYLAVHGFGNAGEVAASNFENTHSQSRDDLMCGLTSPIHTDRCPNEGPYVYVTFHGGGAQKRVKNICKYTKDGCPLGAVLELSTSVSLRNLRGMLFVNDTLVVAESHFDSSKLVQYGQCHPETGRRRFERILSHFTLENNTGLIHPYGLAVADRIDDRNVYVSIQDKSEVLRYRLEDGEPAPFPPALFGNYERPKSLKLLQVDPSTNETFKIEASSQDSSTSESLPYLPEFAKHKKRFVSKSGKKLDPGTFVRFQKKSRIRDIMSAEGRILVADEDAGIISFDQNGYRNGGIPVNTPVALFHSNETNSLWVTSRVGHSVQEFDMRTAVHKKTIKHK
eukprot:Selendium_serpulae@DN5379_c0_g1_i8.p1